MEGGEATQLNDPRLSALSQTPTWREWFVASLATFWSQYMALVLKNLRLARRNWKGTIGLLFAPIMVILFLLVMQQIANLVLKRTDPFPDGHQIDHILKPCRPGHNPCKNLLYAPANIPWVDNLMRGVANDSGLDFNTSFVGMGTGELGISGWRKDNTTMYEWFINNQNTSLGGVIFFAPYVDPYGRGQEIPNTLGYWLFYNNSMLHELETSLIAIESQISKQLFLRNSSSSFAEYNIMKHLRRKSQYDFSLATNFTKKMLPSESDLLDSFSVHTQEYDMERLQEAMQEASSQTSAQKGVGKFSFDFTFKGFPVPLLRVAQLSVANQSGGLLYFIPPMIIFFALLTEIVAEKEAKLRVGMKMMGMSNMAYWWSWYTHGALWVVLVSVIQYLAGRAGNYDYYARSNAFAVLALFVTFGLAMNTVAFFLSTTIRSSKTAQTVGYAIILLGFVFQGILNSVNGALVDMLWLADTYWWVAGIRYVLSLYPPFSFAKAYSDIAALSAAIPSPSAGMIVEGPGFTWADMYKERIVIPNPNFYVVSPPPANSFYTLMFNIAMFGILAWYLDHILAGEHGSPKPFYFLFTREYWGLRKKKAKLSGQDKMRNAPALSVNDDLGVADYDSDVEEEQERAQALQAPQLRAVRLQNISKLYKKWMCCKSDSDTFAVDDVSFEIKAGELFCLLGHNGAGKTTLISMLTGLFKPTYGSATIYGLDLEEDAVRSLIGVCPQHDVLWPELTAREHLLLFSRVKGIPSYMIDTEVHEKLALVGLEHVADKPAGSFSGGMKRRLSVAVACIGDPKLIFLDEPSSGLDPVNKRKIWRMIENLKTDRAIVLTTHSMEEAEVLSDRLAIMAFGKLRAIGDSLHLKNKYGDGYRVSMVVDALEGSNSSAAATAHALFDQIKAKWPQVRLVSNDSGMLLLGCPKDFQDHVPAFLEFVQSDARVKEWGVSHSSLESVFLAVTKKHNFVYEELEDDEDGIPDEDKPLPAASPSESPSNSGRQSPAVPSAQLDPSALITAPNTSESMLDPDFELNGDQDNDKSPLLPQKDEKRKAKHDDVHSRAKSKKTKLNSSPLKALVFKNLTLQWRQRFSTLCQILTPLLIIVILVILKAVIKSQLGNMAEPHYFPGLPIPMNLAPLTNANLSSFGTSRCQLYFATSVDPASVSSPGSLQANGSGHGMLGHIPQYWCNSTYDNTPPGGDPPGPDSPVAAPAPSPVASPSPPPSPVALSHDMTIEQVLAREMKRMLNKPDLWKDSYDGDVLGSDYIIQVENRVPYFVQYKDENQIQREVFANLSTLNTVPIRAVSEFPWDMLVPDAYASFYNIDADSLTLKATISVNNQPVVAYHRPNNFTRMEFKPKDVLKDPNNLVSSVLQIENGYLSLATLLTRAFTSWVLAQRNVSTNTAAPLLNTVVTQAMPQWTEDNVWAFLELAGTMLYPLGLTLQIPLYLYLLTLEKSEKLREMMLSHGLKTRYYHLVNYIFFFVIYALAASMFWIAGLITNSRFFVGTHPSVLVLFFAGWGVALVSVSCFVSAFINSPRVATVAGYVIALFGTALAFLVCVGIYGFTPFSIKTYFPFWILIWPQFSFSRGMYLLNDACALQGVCMGPITQLTWDNEFSKSLLALYLAGIIYYILFLYLDAVLPREYGIPKHPLFFLPWWFPRDKAKHLTSKAPLQHIKSSSHLNDAAQDPPRQDKYTARATDRSTADSDLLTSDYQSSDEVDESEAVVTPYLAAHHLSHANGDQSSSKQARLANELASSDDVQAETMRVLNQEYSDSDPLVCIGLRKVYDGGKLAVKGLHLVVGENECFGLLGENGAGKSTTLSMLTGMFKPSDGTALVGGYDIRSEIDQVHLSMGLCPQFDLLWNDLTVRETLLFYARLKGVPDEGKHVDKLIGEVGLTKAANKQADELSGGMRRRLSIAIALVGDSKIVFLDEPTSGLDAASRRQIWAIIRRAKQGRAIILTTHSMDEAELLCSRIGILAHGKMRCIGNQQHLKSLFGEGVRLKINYAQDQHISNTRTQVIEFVTKQFPSSSVAGDYHGTIEFLLPKDIPVAQVFRFMEVNSPKDLISDWAVSQIGLEDVFQTVVAQSEKDNAEDSSAADTSSFV